LQTIERRGSVAISSFLYRLPDPSKRKRSKKEALLVST